MYTNMGPGTQGFPVVAGPHLYHLPLGTLQARVWGSRFTLLVTLSPAGV
jgi:hypothetical protein